MANKLEAEAREYSRRHPLYDEVNRNAFAAAFARKKLEEVAAWLETSDNPPLASRSYFAKQIRKYIYMGDEAESQEEPDGEK